jgi:glycosyltransferase involved in cell wall biosynthesis
MELKFSIITPSFNSEKYIKDTIESVLSQDYANFEHIIIDGGSLDKTVDIISKYSHIKWISEKDNGPAEAINKGFKIATGDIITWLNTDDFFEKNIFRKINNYFEKDSTLRILIGNITFINTDKNIICKNTTFHYNKEFLVKKCADVVRQPSTFFKKDLLDEIGYLDESLKLVFDYDLFIRMLSITNPLFTNENYTYIRDYKETLSRRFTRRQALEIFKVSRNYGGKLFSRINKTNFKKIILNRL